MYVNYNPNPYVARVGDCVIRAISKVLGQEWEKTYLDVCIYGLLLGNMPSGNNVWSTYLYNKGFRRKLIPDTCSDCYTVRKFAEEHPKGSYVLSIDGHVVAVVDGNYYDTWDSGNEMPVYYWEKKEV